MLTAPAQLPACRAVARASALRRLETLASSLTPGAPLNCFDCSPCLDDGEELYGIRFRADFYVVEAIDEALDEAPLPNRTLLHTGEAG